MAKPTDRKTEVQLAGKDGNAYMIIGLCHKAARKDGWTKEEMAEFDTEATSGDYDHLLMTVFSYFDVS